MLALLRGPPDTDTWSMGGLEGAAGAGGVEGKALLARARVVAEGGRQAVAQASRPLRSLFVDLRVGGTAAR